MICEDMAAGCICHLTGIYAAQMQAAAFMQRESDMQAKFSPALFGGCICLSYLRPFTGLSGESNIFAGVVDKGICYNRAHGR
jgi:hypothetical protein